MIGFLVKAVAILLMWFGVLKVLQFICRKAFAKHTDKWNARGKVNTCAVMHRQSRKSQALVGWFRWL